MQEIVNQDTQKTPIHKVSMEKVKSHIRVKKRTPKQLERDFMKKHGLTKNEHEMLLGNLLRKIPVDTLIAKHHWRHLNHRRNKLYFT